MPQAVVWVPRAPNLGLNRTAPLRGTARLGPKTLCAEPLVKGTIMRKTEPKYCFLALIDLLGFSRAVLGEPLSNVAGLLRKFQSIARSVVSHTNRDRESHGMNPGLRSHTRIFSDLVLVHTES